MSFHIHRWTNLLGLYIVHRHSWSLAYSLVRLEVAFGISISRNINGRTGSTLNRKQNIKYNQWSRIPNISNGRSIMQMIVSDVTHGGRHETLRQVVRNVWHMLVMFFPFDSLHDLRLCLFVQITIFTSIYHFWFYFHSQIYKLRSKTLICILYTLIASIVPERSQSLRKQINHWNYIKLLGISNMEISKVGRLSY